MTAAAVLVNLGDREAALYQLELALQEINARQSNEQPEHTLLSVEFHDGWGVSAEITYSGGFGYFDLLPPNLRGDDFEEALHRLALSPAVDLSRLDAIATLPAAPELHARGLVAVATGALARAFAATTE